MGAGVGVHGGMGVGVYVGVRSEGGLGVGVLGVGCVGGVGVWVGVSVGPGIHGGCVGVSGASISTNIDVGGPQLPSASWASRKTVCVPGCRSVVLRIPVRNSTLVLKVPSTGCRATVLFVSQEGALIEKRAAVIGWVGSMPKPLLALRVSSAVADKVISMPAATCCG